MIVKNLGIELSVVPRLVSSNEFRFSKSGLVCSRECRLGCVAYRMFYSPKRVWLCLIRRVVVYEMHLGRRRRRK